jgi:ketosteroid isomerase-like protein
MTITEAGDLAYDHGTYSIRFDGPDGPVRAEGKYVV